jgi:hypothetical protein
MQFKGRHLGMATQGKVPRQGKAREVWQLGKANQGKAREGTLARQGS